MTRFLIRSTVLFAWVIILVFGTVRISAPDTKPIQYYELKTITLALTKIIEDLPAKVTKVFGCLFLYHALLHVKLSQKLTPNDLVKYSYHKWSKKMLLYITHSKHTRSMRMPMWAFCVYTYKMESGQSVESAYQETFDILRGTLKKECPILYLPDNNNYPMTFVEYMTKVTDENHGWTLTDNYKASRVFLIEEKTPTLKKLAETFVENISIDRLFLSHMLNNLKFYEILTDKFGLIPNDGLFIKYLSQDNIKISNPKTPLQDRLYGLLDVYYHFSGMLKIMMLRLCSYHLTLVKNLDCKGCHRSRAHRSHCNSKISGDLKKFAQLLWLPDDDPLLPLIEQFNSKSNGESDTIEKLQTDLMKVLKDICDLWNLNKSYSENISINFPTANKPKSVIDIIKDIADSAGIVIKFECTSCENVLVCHGIEWTNLYADVFVDFIEKTLTVNGYFLYDYIKF